MWPAIIAAGAGILGGVLANRSSAKAARENREFQERMSSTAHEREVADLRRSGLNPILSANHGASSPGGATAEVRDLSEAGARGVSTALAIRQAKAGIGLMEAQSSAANAAAQLSNAQAGDIQATQANRVGLGAFQRDLAALSAEEKKRLMPTLVERARAEIAQISSAAEAAKARAVLDELARTGAVNVKEFEEAMGDKSPTMKMILELLRTTALFRERSP